MKDFKEISPEDINENFIDLIGSKWMLVTAGNRQKCNTMTASWGGVGEMWGKHMALCVIRPTRYTKEFVDEQDRLTLCFFDEKYRKALSYCGSHSGRAGDKIAEAGLSVTFTESGTPVIAEAKLLLECRKMYVGRFREDGFLDSGLVKKWYPSRDFHEVYFCEIEKAFSK